MPKRWLPVCGPGNRKGQVVGRRPAGRRLLVQHFRILYAGGVVDSKAFTCSNRMARFAAVSSILFSLAACVDSPTGAAAGELQTVALANMIDGNGPNYCAELAALAPTGAQGSFSCENGAITFNGRTLRVSAADALAHVIDRLTTNDA